MKDRLSFRDDGTFTVLQVSDPQDMLSVRKAMTNMLGRAYDTVKPDLVLFTGDNVLGNHLCDARVGTKPVIFDKEGELARLQKSLDHILQPLAKRNIPFAFIFGNHDDRNRIQKEEHAALYKVFPTCVPYNENDKTMDVDTYSIPVYDADGRMKLLFFMLDCAWYDKEQNTCFERIKPETAAWLSAENARFKAQNGGQAVPAMVFTHIPLPVQERLFISCEADDPNAVRKGKEAGYFKLNPQKAQGRAAEYPSVLSDDAGLFTLLKNEGNIFAAVSGHDHKNCFTASVDGIDIIQTSCASFCCYGDKSRCVRVFTFRQDDPKGYTTYPLTYFDLIRPTPFSKLRYYWDADDKLGRFGF